MTIRILIVDDREVVRAELRNVLSLYDGILVVGEAADGWEALRRAEALNPDIVLMDLEMPNLDGFQATRKIKEAHLARSVIALSVYADTANQAKALEAGADAFTVKGTDLAALVELCKKLPAQQ